MSILCSMVGATFTVAAAAEIIRRKKGITAIGNAQVDTAQSQFGGASALLDGSGDSLALSYDNNFDYGTGNFTIEFWYRPATLSGTRIIFDQRPLGAQSTQPTIYTSGTTLFYFANSANQITGSTLATNTWYHIAVSRSGTSTRMFVNGTQVGSTYTDSTNYTCGAGGIRIGQSSNFDGDYSHGHFDEIRISNSARYTSNFTPSTTAFVNDNNTLLLIHADGTDATTFFEDDNGVRSQRGITAIGNAQIDTAQSRFGGSSYQGDGSGDYLNVYSNGGFAYPGDFTIECWVRVNSLSSARVIFSQNTLGNLMSVYANTDGSLVYFVSSAGRINTSANAITLNTWAHVALLRSGTSTRLFVNGTQVGSTYTDTNSYNDGLMYIGSWNDGSSSWSGHIDEFRVSNTARYTANFTAPGAPFVNDSNTLLLLHMNQADASTIFVDDNTGTVTTEDTYTVPTSAFTSDSLTVALWKLDNAGTDSSSNGWTLNTSGGYSNSVVKFGTHSGHLADSTSDFFAHTTDRHFAPFNGSIMTDLTWECWVYYTSWTGASFNHAGQNNPHPTLLLAADQSGNRQSMKFGFSGSEGPYASGLLCFAAGDTNNGNIDTHTARGTTSFSLNTWYHIALTYNSLTGNVKGYVDGVKQFTRQAPNLGYSLPTHFTIGALQSNNSACYVDEVRISRTIRYGI